ncbi:hypothetical protein [Propionivibrio soli]|uniref:hypothetical protein n=1 Tax=Propionivibrio soli TaxID=2976531 RepID=UPI0021E839D9|nr:hypothetical protein [Propionivibrio soli]
MPIPASLVASIVSAIIETATQGAGTTAAQYDTYIATRQLPPEAKTGTMNPPKGDGSIVIDNKSWRLAPGVQFRSQQNLIVMPMTIQETKKVVYLTDMSGAVFRVWMLNPTEVSALQ